MHKYITEIRKKLNTLKNGISKNSSDWTGLPYDEASVQSDIDELDAIAQEISNLAAQLASKKQQAKDLAVKKNLKADGIVSMVKSLYATNKAKWLEYGIRPRVRGGNNAPAENLNLDIADDFDGEGFILWVQKRDKAAKSYIWEKGVSDDPSNTSAIPEMKQFDISTRSEITDNDILAGKRYFYRVRAFNNKGYGPWSDFVSKVQ